MIVEMGAGSTQAELDDVIERAKSLGLKVQLNVGTDRTVVAILGSLPPTSLLCYPESRA